MLQDGSDVEVSSDSDENEGSQGLVAGAGVDNMLSATPPKATAFLGNDIGSWMGAIEWIAHTFCVSRHETRRKRW